MNLLEINQFKNNIYLQNELESLEFITTDELRKTLLALIAMADVVDVILHNQPKLKKLVLTAVL